MRPIIFVKYYDKSSTELGGHQISDALRSRGYHSETLYAKDLTPVRDSILVFIKTSKIHHLLAARRRNNILVLDVMDTVCFKLRIKNRFLYRGLVLAAIEHAKATFGTDVWMETLRLMSRIREETTLDRSIDRYLNFFRRLEAGRDAEASR